jgi:hypothetical protein
MECFLLNRFNLAALISTEWQVPDAFPAQPVSSESFEYYRTTLPAWTMIVCLQGGMMFPEEKIAYEEQALRETCSSLGVAVHESFPSCNGLDRLLLNELLHPWGILKKFNYRGSVHDLNFKSPIRQIARMEAVIKEVCTSGGYAAADIGGYLLPLERGRAVHCEFDLHCNHADARETAQVKDIWLRASEDLITAGAFFDRPYGIWADMLYKRCGTYTEKLRELKKELDPNNILNPGKLCFQ